jgi:hypothetical protein
MTPVKSVRRGDGKAALASAVAVLLAVVPCVGHARQLLPYPSQQQMVAPENAPAQGYATQPYNTADFERAISKMNCSQLQATLVQIAEKQAGATSPADRGYYGELIRIIGERRRAQTCR